MPRRQTYWFLAFFFGVLLTASACGPRATGGTTMEKVGDERAAVDLPAIVLDYDVEGRPSVGGTALTTLASTLGIDESVLNQIHLHPTVMSALVNANVQHVQIDNSVDGLVLLVNGEPIPSLVWDEDSLVATAELMDALGYGIQLLEQVLPTIQTLGIGAIIRFPVAADAELIPTVVVGDESAAASFATAQEAFLDAVGKPPQIQIIVDYAEDGIWQVAGLTPDQWTQVVPAPWHALNLPPTMIANLSAAGIERFGFATNEDGLFFSFDDKDLPHLAWDQGELQHLLYLSDQLGLLENVAGSTFDPEGLVLVLNEWLPVLQSINLRLTVNFPD